MSLAEYDAREERRLAREDRRAARRGEMYEDDLVTEPVTTARSTPAPSPRPGPAAASPVMLKQAFSSPLPPAQPVPDPKTPAPDSKPPFRLVDEMPVSGRLRGRVIPEVRSQMIAFAKANPGRVVEYIRSEEDQYKNPKTFAANVRQGRGGFEPFRWEAQARDDRVYLRYLGACPEHGCVLADDSHSLHKTATEVKK